MDGLIIGYIWGIPGEQPLGKILQECRRNEIPAVLFGTPKTELADCVEIDFFDSAYRLTEYLISRGYREIAFFGADILSTRIQGYLQAMNDHGLKDGIQIREEPSNRLQNAAMFMNQYLQECGRPPRAIIAPNDLGAIGIISALKKQGWRVPEDCAVVGIDNIAIGEYFDPPLTSIGFDNGYFAQLVWDLLEKRLKKVENGPARNLKLHQELVIRGSC
ncbi:MAG: LacI family DNA-binding transcriptional regulator [Victivallales bacterium]